MNPQRVIRTEHKNKKKCRKGKKIPLGTGLRPTSKNLEQNHNIPSNEKFELGQKYEQFLVFKLEV